MASSEPSRNLTSLTGTLSRVPNTSRLALSQSADADPHPFADAGDIVRELNLDVIAGLVFGHNVPFYLLRCVVLST